VKERLKDYTGAFSDYTAAITLRENLERAWLSRGNVLSKLNRLNDAIEDYTVAITYKPEYAAAYYNRALARQRLRQANEACTDMQMAQHYGMKIDNEVMKKICVKKVN